MALLTKEQRKRRFKYLGLEYNTEGIKALQKKYMRKKDVDGKYGEDTDKVLRHVYNVKKYAKNFSPEEFKCECGGKYCTGYPSYMKKVELEHLQSIRAHFGKPMTVTCGLRCKPYNNSLRGSIQNSKHLSGYACDFYMAGVTDTLANRKKAIKWIKKLPNHNYTYGNGINSYGASLAAGYMGNALHTDTNKPPKTTKTAAKKTTTKKTAAKKTTVKKATTKKVTTTKATTKATKKTTTAKKTNKKVTQYLTQAELNKWFAALEKQYKNAKNSRYVWVEGPTYANSKSRSTCIAEHSVALQLLGLLPKGGYFYYHPTKKKISGNKAAYVKKHTELFKLSYPHKKLKTLIKEGKLQPGDIVGFGNPGYHSMVYLGLNSKGKPIFATLGHRKGFKITYSSYANRKVDMIVRLKKVSK